MSEAWHSVANTGDIPRGECRRVEVNHRTLAVFNIDGDFYAVADRCPHKGAPFSLIRKRGLGTDGVTGGIDEADRTIRCPYHYWEFDLETGESVADFGKGVRTYDVRVEEGEVRVRLP